jgi:hypothetical protein
MKKIILVTLLVNLLHSAICQENNQLLNPRSFQKTGFDLRLLGPTLFLALEANHFINHNINIQAGIGLIGFYGGVQYYHGRKDKKNLFTPYSGFNVGYVYIPDYGPGAGPSSGGGSITNYIPLGVQLMIKNGFHLSLEGAWLIQIFNTSSQGIQNTVRPFGSLKIGKNF